MSAATNQEKVVYDVIMKPLHGPPVESKSKELWEGEVTIPDVLPTNLGGCHIILRSYSLKVMRVYYIVSHL